MANPIGWCEKTWNPVTGCTPISEACEHCYAERMAKRLAGRFGYPANEPFRVTIHLDRLDKLLTWKKSRRIFVCSMGDLFHKDTPRRLILCVYSCMLDYARQHTYLILTKRPERMREINEEFEGRLLESPHIQFGVTAENQQRADERIPILLNTPAAVRFVSVEPMLGPVDVKPWIGAYPVSRQQCKSASEACPNEHCSCPSLDWVICGPETGPGARPMDLGWARSLRDQCQAAGVPFYFKGGELDGKTWHQFPEVTHG